MKRLIFVLAAWLAQVSFLSAQSSPNFSRGFVPSPAQWISYFAGKQDVLGYSPVNKAGDTILGRLVVSSGSISGRAALNVAPGTVPSAPVDGDIWVTINGLFVQIGGQTIGPLLAAPITIGDLFLSPITIVDATGWYGLNVATPDTPLTIAYDSGTTPIETEPGALAHFIGTTGFAGTLWVDSFGNVPTALDCRGAGGTREVPAASGAGAVLCQINAQGHDGTDFAKSGRLRFTTAEAWAPTAHGTYFEIFTTQIGTTNNTAKVKVADDGGVMGPPTVTGGSKGSGTSNMEGGFYEAGTKITQSKSTIITTTNTFSPQTWSKTIQVEACGSGGGGGGGARVAASGSGGGGGGAGSCARASFSVADVSFPITCTVGAAGTAGTAASSDSNPGGNGGAGGNTTFGALLTGFGGGLGAGGQSAAASGGGGGAALGAVGGNASGSTAGSAGTGVSNGGAGGSGAAGAASNFGGSGGGGGAATGGAFAGGSTSPSGGATGGGSGGGITAGPTFNAGGAGGPTIQNVSGLAGGATDGASGTSAAQSIYFNSSNGLGGGGGASSAASTAGAGAAGQIPGGGGGGGGTSINTHTAGNGGLGGKGWCRVVEF